MNHILFVLCCVLTFLSESHDWVGTWSCSSHFIPSYLMPRPGLTGSTLQQVVRVSVGGLTIRLRFSNAFSDQSTTMQRVTIAGSKGGGKVDAKSGILLFNGSESVTMRAKGEVYSDPIVYPLEKSSLLAITICFGLTSSSITGHRDSWTTSYITPGCHATDVDLGKARHADQWFVIAGVDVDAGTDASTRMCADAGEAATNVSGTSTKTEPCTRAGAIVVFGDSITDGDGSGVDRHNRWSDVLSVRLLANRSTAHVGVLNAGVGGCCVLNASCSGEAAQDRFERDVLQRQRQSNVRWVVILIGVNDIGVRPILSPRVVDGGQRRNEEEMKEKGIMKENGKKRAENMKDDEDMPTSQTVKGLTEAYAAMALKAHSMGISVIGCTLLPLGRFAHASPARLKAVEAVNAWIRTAGRREGHFDAVVDLHSAMADPDAPDAMDRSLTADFLHPNEAGHKKIGEAFDLGLFT